MPVSGFLLFLSFAERNTKRSPNGIKLHDDFSWTRRHPGDLEFKSEEPRGSHKCGGVAQGGRARPPTLWAPRWPPDLDLPPIYSQIPPKTSRGATKPLFHHRNLLYPWDPIWGPFPAICRRGIRSQRASTLTPLPLRWSVSSLLQTYGSIASS